MTNGCSGVSFKERRVSNPHVHKDIKGSRFGSSRVLIPAGSQWDVWPVALSEGGKHTRVAELKNQSEVKIYDVLEPFPVIKTTQF